MKTRLNGLLLIPALLITSGCDSLLGNHEQADAGVNMGPPGALLQTRAVNRDQLRPIVTLSTGQTVEMRKIADNDWTGSVTVATNSSYTLDVTWVEDIDDRSLELARVRARVDVGATGGDVTFDADTYSFDLDFDGDGRNNLTERRESSDPFLAEVDTGNLPDPEVPSSPPDTNPGDEAPTPDLPVVVVTPVAPPPEPDPVEPDPVEEPQQPATPVTPDPVVTPVIQPPRDDDPPPVTVDPDPVSVDPGPEPEPEPEPVEPDPVSPPVVSDVIIPRIARGDAPSIDGLGVTGSALADFSGEWLAAVQTDTSGARLQIDRLMIDQGAEAEDGVNYRRWAAMHDGEYLYVLVVVDDEGDRIRDSGSDVFDDDSLELFIDGDNSKLMSYDDIDDFHYQFPIRSAAGSKTGVTSGEQMGPFSSDATLELDFATGPGIGPRGVRQERFEQDVYELRIELESAGIEPGQPFGFELQVNDDDDGDERDSKWGWHHPSRADVDVDFTFTNPSFMGTAILE